MSIHGKLALYGPNRRHWEDETYDRILRSRVPRVIWRTDSDPDAPSRLQRLGLTFVAQAPDRFGSNHWMDPTRVATDVFATVSSHCQGGTPVVLDNEPQLDPIRVGQGYAEQYTRYIRAALARWHWLDHQHAYPLVTPGLAPGPNRNGALWQGLAGEYSSLIDGLGLHAYWEDPGDAQDPHFGAPWLSLPPEVAARPLWILEWGNASRDGTHVDHLHEYEAWLRALPDNVVTAALFLLDGTPDWPQYQISDRVIDWLATLDD